MANVTKLQREIWKNEVYDIYKTDITVDEYLRRYLNIDTETRYKLECFIKFLLNESEV